MLRSTLRNRQHGVDRLPLLASPSRSPVRRTDDVRRQGSRCQVRTDRAAAPPGRGAQHPAHPDRRYGLRLEQRLWRSVSDAAFERLAAGGLRYLRFHTTAMCSPTRQALLTGRNHHQVGMGAVAGMASAAPGLHVAATEYRSHHRGDAAVEWVLDGAVRKMPRGANLGVESDGTIRPLADG